MNLEERILDNETYLLEYYPNIKLVKEQITMILDFGMNNETIVEWFRLNRITINIINDLIERQK